MSLFQKTVNGPSSYVTGGFYIQVGQYEKLSSVSVMMDPQSKLGTSAIPSLEASISNNSVLVKVCEAYPGDPTARDWTEIAAGSDLNAASFIVTGDGE